jgi:choline dehydrogenase-like flavoprotein
MLNFGVLTYPPKWEIDSWAALGNPGWSWDDLFPYFLKSETYHPPAEGTPAALNSAYVELDAHGHDGPIQTCFAQVSGPFDEVWQPMMERLGCRLCGDAKKGVAMGAYTHLHSVDPASRTRSYAVTAYYRAMRTGRISPF